MLLSTCKISILCLIALLAFCKDLCNQNEDKNFEYRRKSFYSWKAISWNEMEGYCTKNEHGTFNCFHHFLNGRSMVA
jgi:hypothetical protein